MMNQENVLKVINDEIIFKITQMMSEMSNQEFIEEICQKVGVDLEDEEGVEEISDIIGSRVFPLYITMSKFIVEKELV